MSATFKYDAFLSYSSKDKDFAEELQTSLEKNFLRLSKRHRGEKIKLHIFKDRSDIEGDEDIEEHFKKKIRECRHFIVICSEAVLENTFWVNKELAFYRNNCSFYRPQLSLRL